MLQKSKNLINTKNDNFWNITWEQGIFISNLVDFKSPKRILEIGTSNGFSTLFMSLNLNNSSLIDTVDVSNERQNIAKQNFDFCNISNINIINGNIFEVLPNLSENKYDFIFLDAAHEFYLDLIKLIEKLDILDEDFTFLVDNINSHKKTDFVKYIEKKYLIENINIGSGMLFFKKKL